MKPHKILVACVAVLLILLLSAPLILKHEGIQQKASENLTQIVGEHGTFGAIEWRWLPFPSLVISDFTHNSQIIKLNVPKLLYYPNWLAFFKKDLSLGKLSLIEPQISLKELPYNNQTDLSNIAPKDLKLPKINIEIENGFLTSSKGIIANNLKHSQLIFKDLNADFNFDSSRIKFTINGSSNFAESYKSVGRIDLTKKYYRIDLNGKGLNLMSVLINQQQVCNPQPTNFDFKIHLEGLGLKNWQMNIMAPEAGISSIIANHPVQIDGIDTISITRHDSDYFTTIKNLNFSKIAKSINGNITSIIDDNEQRIFNIDLSAENIDIKSTRDLIPSIFTNNQQVTQVFDVIRGGDAYEARFIFKGGIDDFKHFEKYKIWATAQKLPIFIQGINLYLDETNGPISIINGVLNGKNLTAEIGTQNHGTNGKLLLGLTPTNHTFFLDLNLDVDLIDLQDVLSEIISDDNFQYELANFDIISGRAQGNLMLADDLYNIKTTVNINNFDGIVGYDRIPWRFKIKNGKLNVLPDKVTWSNLNLEYGPHKIINSVGEVDWQDKIKFELTSPNISLDLGSLYDDFHIIKNEDVVILKDFTPVISYISGSASLTDLSLSGDVMDPDSWQYSTEIETSFALSSPHMPPDTLVTEAQAHLTNDKVTYRANFQFFDQKIPMSGDYRHNRLQKWYGYTELDGTIGDNFGNWLKKQNNINEKFFPKTPFAVKNFKLRSIPKNEKIQMQGSIIAKPNSTSPIILKVDFKDLKDDQNLKLSIKDDLNLATVSANISKRTPHKSLFTWQGTLKASSLNTVFNHNFMSSGEASGVFSYQHSNEKNIENKFSGYLEAHNLQLSSDKTFSDLTIHNMLINGEDNKVKIRTLDIGLADEQIHIAGNVTAQRDQYNLDLSLNSDDIHWSPIRSLLDATFYGNNEDPEGVKKEGNALYDSLINKLTGNITFKVENFYYPKKLPLVKTESDLVPVEIGQQKAPETTRSTGQYLFTPIQGKSSFLDDGSGTKVEIESSNLCGMNISGTWYSTNSNKLSKYTIIKDDPQSPLLQETLPCLYTDYSLIEGPYTFKAKLVGEPGNWSDGFLIFNSEEGIIRRMNLLSNIFSVINFTDLFTTYNAENGDNTGLIYSDMVLKSHVLDNNIVVDKAVLKGKGVNITGRGDIDLETYDADLTFFVAPFKMIDSVITSIPFIGKAIAGKKQSILTIPVAVEGPLDDPEITAMDPASIGSASLEFILETLTLPFRIFIPDKEIEYDLEKENPDAPPVTKEKETDFVPEEIPTSLGQEEPLLEGPK